MSPSLVPDNDQLWQLCVADDQKAFDILFRKNFQALCQYASRFNLMTEMVEEVVSDVFINLWLKRKTLEITSIKPYLYTATKNASLNLLKKSGLEWSNIDDLNHELSDSGHNADTNLNLQETEQEIEALVDQLPTQQREVFKLRRLKGYSIEEISAKLDLSPKTVSNHLTQASKFIVLNLKRVSYLLLFWVNI